MLILFPFCEISHSRAKGRNSLRTLRRFCLFPYLGKACPSSELASSLSLSFAIRSFAYRDWRVSCLRRSLFEASPAKPARLPFAKNVPRGTSGQGLSLSLYQEVALSPKVRAASRVEARKREKGRERDTGESGQGQPNKGYPSLRPFLLHIFPFTENRNLKSYIL